MGSLLPVWIFCNSLQLIAHTPLLNTMLPGNAHYVLKEYLDLVRLNWPALNNALYDRATYREHGYEHGFYNVFLESGDYVHLFAQNLVIFSFIGLLILLSWIGLAIKDHLRAKGKYQHIKLFKKPHEAKANNFALRFFMQFFLEICLCFLINIAIVDFSSFSSGIQWLTSMLVLVCVCAYLAWLCSLFFRNGPFLEGFYNPGTYMAATWRARPFDNTFEAQLKLRKQERRQKRKQDQEAKQEILEKKESLMRSVRQVTPINVE